MTATISSSDTKNVEHEPPSNTTVIKAGAESSDVPHYERNACEQHRSQGLLSR